MGIWEIRVAQIECWNTARPYDTGCLQYHTGSTGRIESFNFGQSSSSNYQHLHSQDYAICIRKEAGMCCVEYYICSDTGTATGPICDCTTPFQIVFHTNTAGIAETIATVAQRGFCLEYNQVGC